MGHRLLASLLAFVLFWSGVGTIEGLPSLAQPFQERPPAVAVAPDTHDGAKGSVEDHHLDDMPAQPASEPPLDSPALPPAGPALRLGADVALQRPATAAALRAPPCLPALLRPPCGTARQA